MGRRLGVPVDVPEHLRGLGGLAPPPHPAEFIACVRSRLRASAPADSLHMTHVACHAASVAYHLNRTLAFAPNQGFGYNNSVFMFGLKIYDEAFRRYNMGYACALAWLLVAAVGLCTIVVFKTDKWVQYAND